jgi:hypothetical protein
MSIIGTPARTNPGKPNGDKLPTIALDRPTLGGAKMCFIML